MSRNLNKFTHEVAALLEPKAVLTIPEWALTHLNLPTSSSSEGGPLDIAGRAPFMVKPLADVLDPDIRRIVLMTATQISKAIYIMEKIPTPDGFVLMRDIKIGDVVFDETGKQVSVLSISEIYYGHDCYKVTFLDGHSIVTDAAHTWSVSEFTGKKSIDKDITTQEMYDKILHRNEQSYYENRNVFRVSVAKPIQTAEQILPIDPYLLGVWLGDGISNYACICVGAQDKDHYVSQLSGAGFGEVSPRLPKGKTAWLLSFPGSGLTKALRILGLLKNKHIPAQYLRSSIPQRLALLQGLMDTAGTITKFGLSGFCTSSPPIRDGVSELLSSIGIKHTINGRVPEYTYKGEKLKGKMAYIFTFTVYDDMPIFRLDRKLARLNKKGANVRENETSVHYISSIEKVPSVPTKCIEVGSKSNLYLVSERMVPTHNTLTLLSAILYQAYNNPSPQMLVLPTKTFVKEFNKKRVRSLIRHSPKLATIFSDTIDKSTLVTLLYKGGTLSLVGSGIATDLSSDAIRFLYLDEVDRYAESASSEGSPISVARARLATYSFNSKEVMTSSPVLDTGNIYQNYLLGDQQKYHIPCPQCNEFQELVFEQLKWDSPEDVWYECKHCEAKIDHSSHSDMLQKGKWVPTAQPSNSTVTSYHISVLYSPFYPWFNVVQDYLEAHGDAIKERTFRNSRLGLPYSEQQVLQSHKELYARREDYKIGDPINDKSVVLVCAYDIQDTWVMGIVYAVCAGFELYCVDVIEIRGRFEDPDLQKELSAAIEKTYTTIDGRVLPIDCTAIDIGHNMQSVYDWIKKTQNYDPKRVKAIRGSSAKNPTKPIVHPNKKGGRQLYTIDTAMYKENFYSRLKIDKLDDVTPGYIHYGQLREDHFIELTSESKIMSVNTHTRKPEYKWCITSKNRRNELLDVTVYCLALIEILYSTWTEDSFEERKTGDLRRMKMIESGGRKVDDNRRNHADPRRGAQQSTHMDNFGDSNFFG